MASRVAGRIDAQLGQLQGLRCLGQACDLRVVRTLGRRSTGNSGVAFAVQQVGRIAADWDTHHEPFQHLTENCYDFGWEAPCI